MKLYHIKDKHGNWWSYTRVGDDYLFEAAYVNKKVFLKESINCSEYNKFNHIEFVGLIQHNDDYEVSVIENGKVSKLIEEVI